MSRRIIPASLLASSLLFSFTALAQSGPAQSGPAQSGPAQPARVQLVAPAPQGAVVVQPTPPAQQQPKVYVYDLPPAPSYAYGAPPAPPPAAPKVRKPTGAYVHDGFYLRLGLGIGALVLEDESTDTEMSTSASGFEFALGGTLGNGLVIGGRFLGAGGSNMEVHSNGSNADVSGKLTYATLQFFGDWYLDKTSGFHIEAAIGPFSVGYDPTPESDEGKYRDGRNSDDMEVGSGMGGSIGLGYEWFVSSQWSLGGVFRLNWARVGGSLRPSEDTSPSNQLVLRDNSGVVHVLSPMLMFTGTFH